MGFTRAEKSGALRRAFGAGSVRVTLSWMAVAVAIAIGIVDATARDGGATLVFHASASGQQTLDAGEGGGNPFASALIEIVQRSSVALSELPGELKRLTAARSGGFQSMDGPRIAADKTWSLVPAKSGEVRQALVMVVSDYRASGGAQSLPGAKHDAERIAVALARAGFKTETAIDLDAPAMRRKLDEFAVSTANVDVAAIYTTGHGVEVAGKIHLLPGDYPISTGSTGLGSRSIGLDVIAGALQARRINLLFYGGCRDNPFAN